MGSTVSFPFNQLMQTLLTIIWCTYSVNIYTDNKKTQNMWADCKFASKLILSAKGYGQWACCFVVKFLDFCWLKICFPMYVNHTGHYDYMGSTKTTWDQQRQK